MKRLYIFIVLAVCSYVLPQTCDNPLLFFYNLPSGRTPEAIPDLVYCHDLRKNQSCCSNDTVLAFQDDIDKLRDRLQDRSGTRDLYITQLRSSYLQAYRDLLQELDTYSGEVKEIGGKNSSLGNELQAQYDLFKAIGIDLENINSNFDAALRDYQRTRVICLTTLLKVQASAWCLACDPDYKSKGVSSTGFITFSNTLCKTISNACYSFMKQGDKFSPYYRASQSIDRLKDVTAYLKEYDTNNNTIPTRTIGSHDFNSRNASERTVTTPPNCTDKDNCPWQCSHYLFNYGNTLNHTVAANGAGLIGGSDLDFDPISVTWDSDVERAVEAAINDTETALTEIDLDTGSNTRGLQEETGWSPNLDSTGLLIEVNADPAEITGLKGTGGGEGALETSDDLGSSRLTIGGLMMISVILGALVV